MLLRCFPTEVYQWFIGHKKTEDASYRGVGFMSTPKPTTKSIPDLPPGFDFTDPDIHAERLPVEELAELRRTAPIWWNEQPLGMGGFDDGGFWGVSKKKDVK